MVSKIFYKLLVLLIAEVMTGAICVWRADSKRDAITCRSVRASGLVLGLLAPQQKAMNPLGVGLRGDEVCYRES
jgi:hypothetical protein